MKKFSCVIIDDEEYALERLSGYIARLPELELLAAFSDPLLALSELRSMEVLDVVFLDIDMPELNGLELALAIRERTGKLVFVTAHAKYAYSAFQLKADDYLLKPYSLVQFLACVDKLFQGFSVDKPNVPTIQDDFFFVRSREQSPKLVKIGFKEILMVESQRNYILIHTSSRQVLTYMSLIEIAGILAQQRGFIQIQRGFIIRADKIEYIEGNCVQLLSGRKIIVGKQYRDLFFEFVSERVLKAGKNS